MEAAMYKALSGAVVEMRRLETASQDLANINTAGYKGQRLAFSEVLAKRVAPEDRPGGFVAVAGQRTNLHQGALDAQGIENKEPQAATRYSARADRSS
mgnify:CR=1 FL=1